MKYRVEVGSFCTRFVQRTITVHAGDEAEAADKAIRKFEELEYKLKNADDAGSPQADWVEQIE